MEKKDWKEELWLRVSPTVLEHGKGFGDITLGGATDQQGKENILKAFEQEIDRAREELLVNIVVDIQRTAHSERFGANGNEELVGLSDWLLNKYKLTK